MVPLKILGLKLSLNNFNGVHSTALVVISFLCLPVGLSDVLSHSFCFPLNDQYDLFFLQNSLLILVSYSVPLDPSMIPDLSRVLSFLPPNLVIDQRLNYLVFFFMVTSVQPTERFQKAPLLGKIMSAEEPCQLKLPPVCPNSASAVHVCVESLVDLGLLSSYCTQLLPPLQTEPVLTHIITTQSKLFWGTAEHLGGVLSSDYGCIYNPSSKSL